MKEKTLRRALLAWALFIGIGAVGGSAGMLLDPSGALMGMQGILPAFQVLPFAEQLFGDFVFPGIALFIVNGLTQLFTAALLIKKHPAGARCGIACGVILMLWICIQFCIFPFNFLSTAYFIFGALEALTAILLYRKERA